MECYRRLKSQVAKIERASRLNLLRVVHVDHARRLISMLIYMCDQTENRMVGGELFLHDEARSKADTGITPRHNLMVAFPCTAGSFHSVSEITSMAAPRNYVQVHISSSTDVWPREAASSNCPRFGLGFPGAGSRSWQYSLPWHSRTD